MNWKLLLAITAFGATAQDLIFLKQGGTEIAVDVPIQVAKLTEPKKCPSPPKYEGCWVKTERDLKPRQVPCGTMPMRFLEEGAPEGQAHKSWRQCDEGRCVIDEETGIGFCNAIWCGGQPHWGE